jgi:hypothetical protein
MELFGYLFCAGVYLKVGGGEHCVQRDGCLRLALQRGGRGIDLVDLVAVTAQLGVVGEKWRLGDSRSI